jgi:hypothetical protein
MRTQLSQVSEHSGPPRDLKKTLKRRLIGREGRRQGKPEGILKPMPASRPPQGDFSGGPPSFRQFFLSILGALPCQAPIPVLYGKQSSERETVTRNITFLGLTLLLLTPLALSAGDEEGLPEGQARTVIPVSGMTCGDCCVKVETAVAMIHGVVVVKADYKKRRRHGYPREG